MAPLSFRFGTVGSPLSTAKKPGGSIGGVMRLRELNLDALELGWVQSVRVSAETCQAISQVSRENPPVSFSRPAQRSRWSWGGSGNKV